MPDWAARRIAEFGLAAALLTRLPVGWLGPAGEPRLAVWAYPLVGVVVGAGGAVALWLGRAAELPPLAAAAWALGAMTVATGALHEDGLADTADGLGGGGTCARKLEIMRDSRIGGFGATALILSFVIRAGALAAMTPVALVAASVVARAAMVGVLLLPAARSDGLAASLGRVPRGPSVVAFGLAVAVAFVLLPPLSAAGSILAGAVAALTVARIAWRQVGGHTGDICGAAEQAAECLVFSVLAVRLA